MSGRAFDNGCICELNSVDEVMSSLMYRHKHQSCSCCAPQLQPEVEFVNALINIGDKLQPLATKEKRSKCT